MTIDRPETEPKEACESAALYRLMSWLSPAYPVGAFSYSGGLEWAVEAGDVKDAATLADWLATMIAHGSIFCDAVFFVTPTLLRRPATTRRFALWPNWPAHLHPPRNVTSKQLHKGALSWKPRLRPGLATRSIGSTSFGQNRLLIPLRSELLPQVTQLR